MQIVFKQLKSVKHLDNILIYRGAQLNAFLLVLANNQLSFRFAEMFQFVIPHFFSSPLL